MKIKTDLSLCQGHSVCIEEAPEVFRVLDNSEGYAKVDVILESPGEELRAKVEAAVKYCPNRVISIIEN